MWRYVALFFGRWKTIKKMPNMKGINTCGTFWRSIFKKIRKTEVALCGAMWRYFLDTGKRLKTAKYERNQYIWHFLGSIFKKIRKTIKKMPNMKGIDTYGTFWGSIFKKIRKTAVALCGAMWRYFFGHWKTIKKCRI